MRNTKYHKRLRRWMIVQAAMKLKKRGQLFFSVCHRRCCRAYDLARNQIYERVDNGVGGDWKLMHNGEKFSGFVRFSSLRVTGYPGARV